MLCIGAGAKCRLLLLNGMPPAAQHRHCMRAQRVPRSERYQVFLVLFGAPFLARPSTDPWNRIRHYIMNELSAQLGQLVFVNVVEPGLHGSCCASLGNVRVRFFKECAVPGCLAMLPDNSTQG